MKRPVPVTRALLRRWPLPDPRQCGSKDDRGRVLVIAGSREVPGAALLAATAALRAGAGKLHIATATDLAPALAIALPEARVSGLATGKDGEIATISKKLLVEAGAADAALIGPGMRNSTRAMILVRQLMSRIPEPMVLDAGALPACRYTRRGALVLTPHAGEMASLLHIQLDEVVAAPLAFARQVAVTHDAVVALKGVTTYIACPDGRAWIHRRGCPGLGTSGSGDVLAGIITGLLARGATPEQGAAWAVWLHAQAGLVLSNRMGTVGFLARELLEEIPRLLAL